MKKRVMGMAIVLAVFIGVSIWNIMEKPVSKEESEKTETSQIIEIENEKTATANEIDEVCLSKESKKTDAKGAEKKADTLSTVTDGKIDDKDFSVKIDDVVIALGDDFNLALKNLPEADDIEEANTCIGSGLERVYTYGDVVVYTNVGDKDSIVYTIELKDTAKTLGNIGAGSKLKDIEKVYGKAYTAEAGVYTFSLEQKEMNFYMTNGEVETIDYYLYLD